MNILRIIQPTQSSAAYTKRRQQRGKENSIFQTAASAPLVVSSSSTFRVNFHYFHSDSPIPLLRDRHKKANKRQKSFIKKSILTMIHEFNEQTLKLLSPTVSRACKAKNRSLMQIPMCKWVVISANDREKKRSENGRRSKERK